MRTKVNVAAIVKKYNLQRKVLTADTDHMVFNLKLIFPLFDGQLSADLRHPKQQPIKG